jgi:hypothetical protein
VFGSHGVITLREDGYEGPILAAHATDSMAMPTAPGTTLYLGNTWSPAELTIDELRIDRYEP